MKRVFLLTVFPFSTEVTRASTLSGLSKVTPLVGGSDGLCDSLAGQGAPLQVGPGEHRAPVLKLNCPLARGAALALCFYHLQWTQSDRHLDFVLCIRGWAGPDQFAAHAVFPDGPFPANTSRATACTT